jgi:hypothetical protein
MAMNSTIAQADPWQPHGKGKGKHNPIPEPATYGIAFMLLVASLYVIAKTIREQQRNK